MPVMKYTPQFIERQYIPTQNIGLIDQVLGQRQKEYDTATAMQNAAMSELYGLQTTQGFEHERNKIIEGLQGQITQAAEKRGGDYGAAAQDIAQIISKAQGNPFFQRNRRAIEEAQTLQKLRASNPSIRVLRDPNTVAYDQNLSDEDLQYQIFDPSQMIKTIDQMYEDRKSRRGPLEAASHPVFGTVARQRIGMTDEEIAAESTPENANMILSQMGYGDLAQKDPQLYQEMVNTMYNRLKSFNQGYSDSPWNAPASRNTQDNTSSEYLPFTFMPLSVDVDTRIGGKTDKNIQDIETMMGQDGFVKEPSKEKKTYLSPFEGTKYGMEPVSVGSREGKQWDKFKTYRDGYSALYKSVKNAGGNDRDFLKEVAEIEKAKGYVAEYGARINNSNFTANLPAALSLSEDLLFEYKDGEKSREGLSLSEYNKKFKSSGQSASDFSAQVTPRGEILLQDPDGKKYAVNKSSLSAPVRQYTETMNRLYDKFYNYKLSNEDIDNTNQELISIGGGRYINMSINPDNIKDRVFNIVQAHPETGQPVIVQKYSDFSDIANYFVPLISRDIDVTTFKPKVN